MFQRQIEDYLKEDKEADNQKYITGNATYSIVKTKKTSAKKNLYIFEGFYDLLSFICYFKGNIDSLILISLNGTGNVNKLISDLENDREEFNGVKFIKSYCDNDDTGKETSEEIKKCY